MADEDSTPTPDQAQPARLAKVSALVREVLGPYMDQQMQGFTRVANLITVAKQIGEPSALPMLTDPCKQNAAQDILRAAVVLIHAQMEEFLRTMARVLTGMRIGEILGLRWRDVDLMACQLRIRQTICRGAINTPKTKGSWRLLPLPHAVVRALVIMRPDSTQITDTTLVFSTAQEKPLSDTNPLHRHLKPAGRKIGTPWLNWHTLRRTHATLLQLAGGSLKDAQAQLGHTKLSTTLEVYTLPVPNHQREAVENLARMVTNGDESDQRLDELPLPSQQIQ